MYEWGLHQLCVNCVLPPLGSDNESDEEGAGRKALTAQVNRGSVAWGWPSLCLRQADPGLWEALTILRPHQSTRGCCPSFCSRLFWGRLAEELCLPLGTRLLLVCPGTAGIVAAAGGAPRGNTRREPTSPQGWDPGSATCLSISPLPSSVPGYMVTYREGHRLHHPH